MERVFVKKIRSEMAAKRRSDMLEKQQRARRDLVHHARQLAMDSIPTSAQKKKTREHRLTAKRDYYSRQLLVPEWMTEIPADLNGKGSLLGNGWYVLPRPEGKRCIVISNKGVTVARLPSGAIFKKLASCLPSGSRQQNVNNNSYCILDCMYQESNSTFYVLDVMCWKGYLLYNCTTEFRFYWVREKLAEVNAHELTPSNSHRFLQIPYFECDKEGILQAYSLPCGFIKDGLLFYMKAGHYTLGISPLVLIWKDNLSSRYFDNFNNQSIVLQLRDRGHFATLEGITMNFETEQVIKNHELEIGDLVRFEFDSVAPRGDGTYEFSGLKLLKRCSIQRALADSWTKAAFYTEWKSGKITIDRILDVATEFNE